MTNEFTPTLLERKRSINRSIWRIDQAAADIAAMLEKAENEKNEQN